MIRQILAVLFLIAVIGGGLWVALWFDRHVVEPALSRAAARALGITAAEYRDIRAAEWRRVRCFLVHRWWVPTVWEPFAPSGHYLCRRCGESWGRP